VQIGLLSLTAVLVSDAAAIAVMTAAANGYRTRLVVDHRQTEHARIINQARRQRNPHAD
jgi:hypothetical protein